MQQFFDFPVTPSFSFADFVSCDGNSSAIKFAMKVADPTDSENLLYLYGASGSGKTHLLRSISADKFPYISLRDQITPEKLTATFLNSDALIVDDLQYMPEDLAMQRALWQLFNDYHTSGRIIAMAGLFPPRELPNIDDHLTSRLLWGLVARLDISDDNSCRMIIKKIAEDRQIRIADEVVDYIIATSSREVVALIAYFNKLYSVSMAEKRRINLPLAREVRELLQNGFLL